MNDSKCTGEHGEKKKKRYPQDSLYSLNLRLAQEHEKKNWMSWKKFIFYSQSQNFSHDHASSGRLKVGWSRMSSAGDSALEGVNRAWF